MTTLAHLPKLQGLNLDNTQITDSGLEQLAVAKDLIHLSLRGTVVTPAGIAKLKQALPNLDISDP